MPARPIRRAEDAQRSHQGTAARCVMWALAAALMLVPACSSHAQATLPPPVESGPNLLDALSRRGDLTLQGGSLQGALLTIGEQWGVNIVAGDLEGAVNGSFKRAPLREILDSILLSNGYGYRMVGDSLVVSPLGELGQVNPYFISETIRVRAADISDVAEGAKLLSTPSGQVRAIPSARSIVVLDFPDRVEKIRQFIASVDNATINAFRGTDAPRSSRTLEVAYLKTHHVAAKDMLDLLGAVLSTDGKATVMKKEDRLLIVDYPENLQLVRQVVQHADRPRPQVVIQALIYDISLQDLEELGLNWHNITNGSLAGSTVSSGGALTDTGGLNPGTGSLVNSVTKLPFADGSAGGAFTLYNLGSNFSMAAVALALQNAADSRLLASPNVTVIENEQATIQSVSEIPYQQLTQTAAGGNIGTTAFKEAGITLDVTPKIANDGTIEMLVRPEFSRLTGFTPGDNQPIIDKRVATTNVRILNGQTFVIGGLRQRSDVGDFNGIPFLKDVRFIGPLFRSRETDIRESELMVFIRPTIVGYSHPLSEREQRAADAIDCRLDRIPPAEGCPGGYCEPKRPCDACNAAEAEAASETLPGEPVPAQPSLRAPSEASLGYPDLAIAPELRRLPPVRSSPGGQHGEGPRSFANDLRSGYDSRYRRANDDDPAAKPEEVKTARPWYKFRMFR